VEDFNYDPEMDTWPLNTTDIDALLAGANPLNVADIDSLPTSLKGFHAIEYMLFGIGGVKTAAQFTPRETQYLLSLSENLHNITISLQNSWLSGGFTSEWTSAGAGSTRFPTRRDAFIALVTAMAGICEEVGEGKIADPFLAQDSTLEESRFSHNSTTDFRNNMIGVSNAYYGNYVLDGAGLNGLVRIKNASLDLKIQSQLTAVINSFNNIDPNFGLAIYTQQGQIMDLQTKIDALKETLETELIPWINVWVTQ
jgi:predicted lipoprotein